MKLTSVNSVPVERLNPDGFQGHREWLVYTTLPLLLCHSNLKFPLFDSLTCSVSFVVRSDEINYLGQLSHQNLVKLIGYCVEDEQHTIYCYHGILSDYGLARNCPKRETGYGITRVIDATSANFADEDATSLVSDHSSSSVHEPNVSHSNGDLIAILNVLCSTKTSPIFPLDKVPFFKKVKLKGTTHQTITRDCDHEAVGTIAREVIAGKNLLIVNPSDNCVGKSRISDGFVGKKDKDAVGCMGPPLVCRLAYRVRRGTIKKMNSQTQNVNIGSGSSNSSSEKEEHLLWNYVTKLAKLGATGGTWKFKCSFCNEIRQGSYPRVKAHLLGLKG
ncbi:hypothetical protein Bca4012_084343 [Brassica carinata]